MSVKCDLFRLKHSTLKLCVYDYSIPFYFFSFILFKKPFLTYALLSLNLTAAEDASCVNDTLLLLHDILQRLSIQHVHIDFNTLVWTAADVHLSMQTRTAMEG